MKCEDIEISLTGYLDRELTQQDAQRVEIHLAGCERCRQVLEELRRAQQAAGSLEIQQPSVNEWRRMENRILEKGTRRLGWSILIVWLTATVCFALYQFAVASSESLAVKILVFGVLAGLGLLFVSVLMERMRESRTDRYKGVQR